MKLMFRPPLLHLFLCCATQALGIRIVSVPEVNGNGVVQTELKNTVSLVCQAEADEELVWMRNGAGIILKEGNTKGQSKVCVTPVIHQDNGATFTCHLRNNDTVSALVTLNVTYPPEVSGSDEVLVEEEAVLVLLCDIWANPQVSSVSWKLNGSEVDLLANGFTLTNDGFTSQLVANRVERSLHEGTYECTVASPLYPVRSKLFHVTVTEKTLKFPMMPIIAGVVIVCLTSLLAIVSRWNRIVKCCK